MGSTIQNECITDTSKQLVFLLELTYFLERTVLNTKVTDRRAAFRVQHCSRHTERS